MSELVTVQPAKPGKEGSYGGLSGVYYFDDDTELAVFFAVTLRCCLTSDNKLIYGTMEHAEHMMKDICALHASKKIQIDPLCFWKDPADQRPPSEAQGRTATPPPQNRNNSDSGTPTGETQDGKPIKSLAVAKIKKGYNDLSSREEIWIYTRYGNKIGDYPDVRIALDVESQVREVEAVTGKRWGDAKVGSSYEPTGMTCYYVDSSKTNKNGKPYKNFVRLEVETNDIPF